MGLVGASSGEVWKDGEEDGGEANGEETGGEREGRGLAQGVVRDTYTPCTGGWKESLVRKGWITGGWWEEKKAESWGGDGRGRGRWRTCRRRRRPRRQSSRPSSPDGEPASGRSRAPCAHPLPVALVSPQQLLSPANWHLGRFRSPYDFLPRGPAGSPAL